MIYRQPSFLFVPVVAATAAFLAAAYGAYPALGLQHGIPFGWRYAEQTFHSPTPITLLHLWIIAVALLVALTVLLIYAIGMACSPKDSVIRYTSFALRAVRAIVGWKQFFWLFRATFCACSHYARIARNLA